MLMFTTTVLNHGLFEDWTLVKVWFTTENEANLARQTIAQQKIKKGYQANA